MDAGCNNSRVISSAGDSNDHSPLREEDSVVVVRQTKQCFVRAVAEAAILYYARQVSKRSSFGSRSHYVHA